MVRRRGVRLTRTIVAAVALHHWPLAPEAEAVLAMERPARQAAGRMMIMAS
jgi:hypothetical protein